MTDEHDQVVPEESSNSDQIRVFDETTDNAKWENLLQHLMPKKPLYCPETPSLKQNIFLRYGGREALYGGAAGGGKSSALLMAALQYVDVPDYSAILFRKTFADLNLPGALMDRFRTWMSNFDDVRWNDSDHVATFPSGARITFGYLNNTGDKLRYQGSEFQFIGFDEVTHIRQEDYRYLASRLRSKLGPLSKVPLRIRSASNPAPNWVRQHFIVEGPEKGRIFVPASLEDNPGLDADEYRKSLAMLSPVERRQLEFGDWWASMEGSLFKREDFAIIPASDLPEMTSATRYVRFWDLAATEPNDSNPNPDWTVGTLMAFDRGRAFVLDVKKARVRSEKVETLVANTAWTDGKHVAIRMEQEPGSAGKSLVDQYARYIVPGFDFAGLRATGDKVTRARPFGGASHNGNVVLVEGPWISEWLDELTSFPEACDHDDQVDSATGAFNYIAGLGIPQRSKLSIIV